MEPASGETGVCRVRDDKSRPNGQAESTNAHSHLISSALTGQRASATTADHRAEGWPPGGDPLALRTSGADGGWPGDLSRQQVTKRSTQ